MTSSKESQPTVRGHGPLEKQLDLVATQPGQRKGKAFLMVSTGAAAGTVFPLADASVLIGRSLDAQVSINASRAAVVRTGRRGRSMGGILPWRSIALRTGQRQEQQEKIGAGF